MATAYERFQSKLDMIDDSMQRIFDVGKLTESRTREMLPYLESQLSRIQTNTERALRYLEEIGLPGTIDTEIAVRLDEMEDESQDGSLPPPLAEKIARG